ncbi:MULTISPECIES: glycosyltransferase [unclassified Pseudoalteromonas]|uniref:glycosyltransferase n=1 Tax=unclassified Pseudoalteromonas TaxID=194690 RepID=UPI001F32EE89|nr:MULTISPECIES: glycosyltransferase [unclassified Pseudoalteromonas]MCF2825871.1 glycosyltransferase [Pseudoalteromonas sp. OF5H-5]MCF2834385.1 glycosyltransferase [Pseudoalteromonas sp. DL2-H6]MCF2927259.1 glycosyltransferase [Pseudoalteromonas sp. DL2-H1]
MSNKNIAFFVSGLDSGGIENYLLRFLQYKHKAFNNIYVYCKSGKGGQLEGRYLELYNVTVIKEALPFIGKDQYKALKRFLIKHNVDAVCDFTGNFSGRVLYIAKSIGISKRIAFYRGSKDHFKRSLLKNLYNSWVKSLVYKNSSDILSNSKAAFDYFFPYQWKNDNRFAVIYNGINTALFLEETSNLREEMLIPDDAFVIGHTGRFNEAKNHQTILQVADKIISKYDDVYFILCGNGVKCGVESYFAERKLPNRILAYDNRDDIPKFLNTMDCYFFPSLTEGQPNALIEAMVMGLPFVASNIPSIAETVITDSKLNEPLDVLSFSETLDEFYKQKVKRDVNLQQQTREKFDHRKRFNEFFQILNKE